MKIITTREFRANQKKYFDMAEKETILISRKNKKPIALIIQDEEDILTKHELESINKGLEDIKAGRVYETLEGESLNDFLARTEKDKTI